MPIDAGSQKLPMLPQADFRTIVDLAIPAIAENLLTTLVLFANTILIGWLRDDTALAAMGLSNSFLWIANGIFQALGIATTAMVARSVGKGDMDAAKQVVAQSLFVGALIALVITATGTWLSDSLIRLMGAEPEVVAQGGLYMRIVLATTILAYPMLVAAGAMRGAGDMRTPLLISLITNVERRRGVSPHLRPRSAARTAAGRSCGCYFLCQGAGWLPGPGVFLGGRTAFRLEPRSLLGWDGSLVRRIVRLALPNLGRRPSIAWAAFSSCASWPPWEPQPWPPTR